MPSIQPQTEFEPLVNISSMKRRMRLAFPMLARLARSGPLDLDWPERVMEWLEAQPDGTRHALWIELQDLGHMGMSHAQRQVIVTEALGVDLGSEVSAEFFKERMDEVEARLAMLP